MVVFHPPEGSMNTNFSCPRGFSALCPSSCFPHWEQQDASMVINIQIFLRKISFTLYGAHLEKDTKSLEGTLGSVIVISTASFISEKARNIPGSRGSFLQRQRIEQLLNTKALILLCANLDLQGNFRHVCHSSDPFSLQYDCFSALP